MPTVRPALRPFILSHQIVEPVLSRNTPAGTPAAPTAPKGKGGGPKQPVRDETDSFIAEVSDELRRDRMNRAFRRYGPFLAGAIVLIVLGTAGYEFWRYETRSAARSAGGVLASAARSDAPEEAFAQAAKTLEGGPRIVADLAAATALAEKGAPAEAVPFYESVESTPEVEPLYAHLAALRSVMARLGTAPTDELLADLAPLTAQDAPFAPLALEIDAGLKLELGREDDARASLTAALADPRASQGQRRRIQDLLNSLPPVPGAEAASDADAQAAPAGDAGNAGGN